VAEIRHSARTRRDLIEIWLRLSDVNPRAADDLYRGLEARVEILRQFPESGPRRQALGPEARILVEPPYLILYRLIPEGVQIVRVLHGARRIGASVFSDGVE